MVFVDIHAHLDFKDFDCDREVLIKEFEKNKVLTLSNTTSPKNYEYTKSLFKNCKSVKVCPGLYPQDAEKISNADFDDFLKGIEKNQHEIVAIGEIGLDKHHTKDEELFKIQVIRFRQIIELGIKIDKPLIIHTRKAEKEVLYILEEYVKKTGFKKFNLHCFCGKKKFIPKIIELGIYCSIPLLILNTHSFQILVQSLPIKKILVETDSPFLNPSKERNSPLNIPKIYEKIAEIKKLDKVEIENIIYANYMRFIM